MYLKPRHRKRGLMQMHPEGKTTPHPARWKVRHLLEEPVKKMQIKGGHHWELVPVADGNRQAEDDWMGG